MTDLTDDDRAPESNYFSRSLARGLSVIRAFDRTSPKLKASEIALRTGLPRAVARRFLLTLRDLGYVGDDGDRFFLLPRVLELGYAFIVSADIDTGVVPLLDHIARQTQEAASFGVLDGNEVLTLARVTRRAIDLNVGPGTRFPAHATALGHVLLAGLEDRSLERYLAQLRLEQYTQRTVPTIAELRQRIEDVRKKGYAVVSGEFVPELYAIAVPVLDTRGNTVASLNVTKRALNAEHIGNVQDDLEMLLGVASQINGADWLNQLFMRPESGNYGHGSRKS